MVVAARKTVMFESDVLQSRKHACPTYYCYVDSALYPLVVFKQDVLQVLVGR